MSMKPNRIKKLMMGFFLVITLLAGIGLTTAEAQRRRGVHRPSRIIVYRHYNPFWHRYYDPFWSPFSPSYRVVDPIAYEREQGFREGREEGKEDAKKERPANARGHKDYLKSNSLTFREAFVQGYNSGYQEKSNDLRDGE
jgi:hypothetical protein